MVMYYRGFITLYLCFGIWIVDIGDRFLVGILNNVLLLLGIF